MLYWVMEKLKEKKFSSMWVKPIRYSDKESSPVFNEDQTGYFPLTAKGAYFVKFESGDDKTFENIAVAIPKGKEGDEVVLSNVDHFAPQSTVFDLYNNDKLQMRSKAPLSFDSKMELVELAKEGIVASAIPKLAELLQITQKQVSDLLNMSERTLRKYIKENGLLNTDASEKVLKIFALFLYGCEVLDGSINFVKWINKPSFGLRNKLPIDLLYTSDGIDLVHDELRRIEYGDLA